MNKSLFTAASMLLMAASGTAQTWEQLPYHYERTMGKPKIFASAGNTLVAGIAYNSSPESHASTDGGATWHQVFADKPVAAVEFGPDGRIYFIAMKRYLTTSTYNIDTLFTSTDAATWTNAGYKVKSGDDEYSYEITSNNTLLFPHFSDATGKYISKSADYGATWSNTALMAGPITCSGTGDTIITSYMSPFPGGIRYSHDGGATVHDATWASGAPGGTIPVRTPDGTVYAAAVGQIFKSTDGGATFGPNLLSGSIGAIQEFIYASNGKFYIRVSGGVTGIWETSDFVTLNAITSGLPDYSLLSDMDVSDSYVYAVTDTNLYRYPLSGGTSAAPHIVAQESLNVYPNPAAGVLRIDLRGGNIDRAELVNVLGRAHNLELSSEGIADVSRIAPGTYLLRAFNGEMTLTTRIIINRQ